MSVICCTIQVQALDLGSYSSAFMLCWVQKTSNDRGQASVWCQNCGVLKYSWLLKPPIPSRIDCPLDKGGIEGESLLNYINTRCNTSMKGAPKKNEPPWSFPKPQPSKISRHNAKTPRQGHFHVDHPLWPRLSITTR
jgi:hypothetical protein